MASSKHEPMWWENFDEGAATPPPPPDSPAHRTAPLRLPAVAVGARNMSITLLRPNICADDLAREAALLACTGNVDVRVATELEGSWDALLWLTRHHCVTDILTSDGYGSQVSTLAGLLQRDDARADPERNCLRNVRGNLFGDDATEAEMVAVARALPSATMVTLHDCTPAQCTAFAKADVNRSALGLHGSMMDASIRGVICALPHLAALEFSDVVFHLTPATLDLFLHNKGKPTRFVVRVWRNRSHGEGCLELLREYFGAPTDGGRVWIKEEKKEMNAVMVE